MCGGEDWTSNFPVNKNSLINSTKGTHLFPVQALFQALFRSPTPSSIPIAATNPRMRFENG
jgi:hypothetical protein